MPTRYAPSEVFIVSVASVSPVVRGRNITWKVVDFPGLKDCCLNIAGWNCGLSLVTVYNFNLPPSESASWCSNITVWTTGIQAGLSSNWTKVGVILRDLSIAFELWPSVLCVVREDELLVRRLERAMPEGGGGGGGGGGTPFLLILPPFTVEVPVDE